MNVLAQMSWLEWALAWLLILVCCFLMLVILLQRGRGGGLSAAFGGGGGATAAFGAKTGDVFTWITVVGAAVFVLLAVISNFAFDKSLPPARPPQVTTTTTEPETSAEEEEAGTIEVAPIEEGAAETQPPPVGEEAPDDAEAPGEVEGATSADDALPESADEPVPVSEESAGGDTGDEPPDPGDSGAKEQPRP